LYSDSCQSIVVVSIAWLGGIAQLGGSARLVFLKSLPLLYSDFSQWFVVVSIARLGGIAQLGSAGVTRSHYLRSRCLLSDA